MFDFDAGKIIIVGIIALIFIPPKDLPRVLRQVGQFVGKMRRMAADFQGQFMDAMREADMADLRKEAQKLADAARIDTNVGSVEEHNRDIMRAVSAKPLAETKPVADTEPADVAATPEGGTPTLSEEFTAFDALRAELKPMVVGEEGAVSVETSPTHAETPAAHAPHSA